MLVSRRNPLELELSALLTPIFWDPVEIEFRVIVSPGEYIQLYYMCNKKKKQQ